MEKRMASSSSAGSTSHTTTLGQKLVTNDPFAYNTLVRIFRYLNLKDLLNCAEICPLWQWISLDESLWKCISVVTCPDHIHGKINLYYNSITHLEILNANFLSNHNFTKLCLEMRNLQQIALYGCHIEQLNILAENSLQIKRLYAEICWGHSTMDFIGKFEELTHLDLITDASISNATFLKELKHLKHISLFAPCEENVWKEVLNINTLESLSLHMDSCSSWPSTLFELNFNIRHLKNLRKLHITDLYYEYEILDKIKLLPNIKELVLENASISRAGTSNFATQLSKCNHIERFTISINRIIFYNNILDIALENSEILNGVIALKNNLKYFCWLMDELGMSEATDFYHKYNITAIKTTHKGRRKHAPSYAMEVVPISLPNLLKIFQKKLPGAEVLLLDPETVQKAKQRKCCYDCGKKFMKCQDLVDGFS